MASDNYSSPEGDPLCKEYRKNRESFTDLPALRMSLFPNVPPFLNYIPTLDGGKIFPPSSFREQLWRIPQGVGNILDYSRNQRKPTKQDEKEDITEEIFPDNIITIANFKNKHFGTPLTQANINIIYHYLKEGVVRPSDLNNFQIFFCSC